MSYFYDFIFKINSFFLKPFLTLLVFTVLIFNAPFSYGNTSATSCLSQAEMCSSNVCQNVCESNLCFGWKWHDEKNVCQKTADTDSMLDECDLTHYEENGYNSQTECVEDKIANLQRNEGYEDEADELGVSKELSPEDKKKLRGQFGGINVDGNFKSTILGDRNTTKVIFWTHTTLLATLATTFITGKALVKSCPTSKSIYMLTLGSIAALGGEIYLWQDLKKKMDNEKNKLQSLEETDVPSIQKKVFDFLSANYDHRSKNEKNRFILHIGTSVIFGIATALATYEAIQALGSSTCTPRTSASAEKLKSFPLIGTYLVPVVKGLQYIISKQIIMPIGRIILSTTLTSLSITLSVFSKQIMDITKEREKFVEKIRKSLFESTTEYYCNQSDNVDGHVITRRENPNIPKCYCYNEKGTKNITERSNSDICKNYWDRQKALEAPDAIENEGLLTEKSGCVDINGNYDALCKCRHKFNKKKENACLKEDQKIVSSLPGGVGRYMNDTDNIVSSIGDGSLSTGTFSPTKASRAAANLKKINDKKTKDINKKRVNDSKKPIDFAKAQRGLLKKIDKNLPFSATKKLTPLSSTSRPLDKKNRKSGLKQKQGSKNRKAISYKSTKRYQSKKKNKDQSEFIGERFSRSDRIQNLGHANKEKKYKLKSTISKRSTESIWKMLSSRYQKSAFQKLFKDD